MMQVKEKIDVQNLAV